MINALINKYAFFSRPFLLLRLLKAPTIAGVTLTMSLLGGLTGCQKQTDNPSTSKQSTSNQSPSNSQATNNTSAKNNVSSNTVIDSQLPTVYATTNVWGSVAKAVGGDKVNVIVGVDDLSQDPHDYQATAIDKLNITKSAVMLVNGGGYDDWGMSLAESVSHKPVVINAVALSGLSPNTDNAADESAGEHQHDTQHEIKTAHPQPSDHPHVHGDFNEHVFFSLDTAKKVAEAVNKQLAATSPANQAIYAKNTQHFIQQIDALKVKAKQIGQQKAITAFATEPVTGYLLADMGIKDVTPKAYVVQSETDAGVSVKVLNDSKSLLSNKQVGLLVVNAQTEDATSKQLITLAKASTVPVVAVYETLPDGVTSYTQFIEKTLDDFAAAMR
ncbi:MAG: zinc ABC transporter substrate-binding protein [Moraxella sp.]|jgi:zinc/manganese transport system substrate-binding protein|uniref:Zinc ABC transporter solute-binding protein n=1 Tax=Faucicola osloensis TaxID=34062 RepID=A0A6P1KM60_FAUOS|nr:zinc ABC transporter substrate-binding protein [Moraxella osloensis]MBP6341203.1 zinc ABC transporter substrate-binding protein [Moraxella sp.]MBP6484721.1 zinc ABC transporter substrate-binding protein [Moraxella sp.]MBP7234235.1 zinc ABC transporter substrate-binding protein [Moraxella sp.]QHG09495.1 zinc ABC transporter solute-binding protein [Moraxella osloensis]